MNIEYGDNFAASDYSTNEKSAVEFILWASLMKNFLQMQNNNDKGLHRKIKKTIIFQPVTQEILCHSGVTTILEFKTNKGKIVVALCSNETRNTGIHKLPCLSLENLFLFTIRYRYQLRWMDFCSKIDLSTSLFPSMIFSITINCF